MRLYQNKLKLYSNGKLYNVIMKPKELEGFAITYNIDTGNSTTSTVKAGTPVLNYAPTKDGYTFIGWREDSTANETVLSGTTATKDMTLYAVFSKSITVSYNANGGSGSTSSNSGTMYYNNGNTLGATITLRSNGFSYTNRTFQKWASGSAAGTQYSVGATVTITSDTTFYAIWKGNAVSNKTLDSGQGQVSKVGSFDTTGYSSVTIIFSVSSPWAWMWLDDGQNVSGTYDGISETLTLSLTPNSGVKYFTYACSPEGSYGGYDTNTSWTLKVTAS